MASGFVHSDVPTVVAENETQNVQSGILSTANNKEIRKKKLIDSSHGLRFESKLLLLFCVRALGAGYKFELSKEKEEEGGKLEDLIFRYEVTDKTPAGKHWRYRYLQAKHKENEGETITADQLLDYKPKGDFCLPKYFHSFLKIRARGDDIHDCIICTNIGFNLDNLEKGGVELVSINDQPEYILEFGAPEKTARYKLKINNEDWHRKLKDEWSPVQLLADELKDCATKNKTTDIRAGMLNNYHVALVDERVIDCATKKFHQNFVGDAVSLSEEAKELRRTICKLGENDSWKNWKFKLSNNFGKGQSAVKNPLPRKITVGDVDDFFDKFVFVVDMPNEKNFEEIIETRDMSKYYQPDKRKDQTVRILHEVSKEFSNQEQKFWLKSERAKSILLDGVTKISLEYQSQLEKEIKFNDSAIQMMVNHLKQLLESTRRKKVEQIATPSPQHTAVKVISAVQILMRELKQKVNYLITSSSRLKNEDEMEMWKNILKLQIYSHHFFVIVCGDEASVQNLENLISDEADDENITILIGSDTSLVGITDEIKYIDLSEDFHKVILSTIVSFQGENKTVGDLVGDKPEEVIDFSSMKELLLAEKEVKIRSFNTSTFEETLYVKRRLRFPFENQLELDGECQISPDGNIEWLVEKEKRKEVWKKIRNSITNQASPTGDIVQDSHLINFKGKKNKQAVIISGAAGTGKSTILSHYYKEMKINNPDHWIIRINLVDHYKAISKLDKITRSNAVDFIVNELHLVDYGSSFSCSLLRHRMETGDRIVVMFDGFDEINNFCQEKVIRLMKTIRKNRSIQLFVTTRAHAVDNLQVKLSQLTYSLENFTEKDQIDYLTSYWVKELNLSGDNESIQQFAKSLVKQVSDTLKDDEKSFIGIPLQCRILAECFQSNVKELIITSSAEDREEPHQLKEFVKNQILYLLDDQKFDLISLFNRLIETKRKVFREEKANAINPNQITDDAINHLIKDIEDQLTIMAIETVTTDQSILEMLWPPQLSHRSDEEVVSVENLLALNILKFGLTFKSGDHTKIQFLHRTYAEYLFASYLYKGFLVDDKRHNKLLENVSIQKLILNEILSTYQFDGVQVFFNSMLKELVDSKEWRNRIVQRNLPERLKKFVKNLYIRILNQIDSKTKWFPGNILHYLLSTKKTQIFTFLCECLDVTFDKNQIQLVMTTSFMHEDMFFPLFYELESPVFKRFIDYFDADKVMSKITFDNLPPSNLEYFHWNGEEQQKNVHHLLQLMTNQREAFEEFFCNSNNEFNIQPVLSFFIFNENYDSHLKKFLELLSRSTAYSHDSKFANFLKKAIYSQKHFVGGRIEKVLLTLQGLKRQNLLSQLYGVVLTREPEAFQHIYQPLPLEGDSMEKELEAMAFLNKMMERDSYRLTRLHRAAYYGNTEAIDKMLGKIRQSDPAHPADPEHKNVADKIVNEVMARDEYGFTPFYVAAACGHEEIYHNMLAFMKQVLPNDTLAKHLIDEEGFVYRALSEAIDLKNIQMFQLILKAVKKALGQKELLRVLNPDLDIHPGKPDFLTFFNRCCTKELFNAMAKIVVMRDNATDYTDLYDLVFHNFETKQRLEYIDAENLQGLLILKGVDDFTKQLLHKYPIYLGFNLLMNHLLRFFTKAQLEEFVETITSKTNNKKNEKISIRVKSVKLDPAQMESITLKCINNGWTKEDLEFRDEGNGFTAIHIKERLVPINSYWRDFIMISRDSILEDDMNDWNISMFLGIFDCLKCLSDTFLKKLLLHEEKNGFIIIQSTLTLTAVEGMLTYLSKESQEEVKQQWKNKAPSMETFFHLTAELNNTFANKRIGFARYLLNILLFYLDYGSEVHLYEFIKTITSSRDVGEERRSVWGYIVEHCNYEKEYIIVDKKFHREMRTNELLKKISEKTEILGSDAVKTILLDKIDKLPLLIEDVFWGHDIDARLEILPKEISEEIQQFMKINTPGFIDQAFENPQTHFKIFDSQHYYKRLNTLISFLNYSSDCQLQLFVQNITLPHYFIIPNKIIANDSASFQQEKTCSIWAELFTHECNNYKTDTIAKMDKFMKIVLEKLGSNAVKELVLHNYGERPVIFYPAIRREESLLKTMLKYLSVKDRKKVQRQVDALLEKTSKMTQDGN